MTIALGMLAHDGIVVAADTQVGQEGFLKNSEGKIAMTISRGADTASVRSFVITGAGNAAYLNALRKRMSDCFSSDARNEHMGGLEKALQESLTQFYAEHVIPFDRYPPDERPDFWLIMGAQHGDHKLLWSTEKNVLIPHDQCAAVGSGATYAMILLGNTYVLSDSNKAALLAAYITLRVKQHIDGCGQDTDIFVLRKKLPSFVGRKEVRELEEIFREFSRVEAGVLLHALGHDIDYDPQGTSVTEALEQTRESIKNIWRSKGAS